MASSEQQSAADNAITTGEPTAGVPRGSTWEVATLFLKLGFTAFGGPAAHIAMIRDEVVHRRRWIGDGRFLDLVGAVNLIPGPRTRPRLALYLGYLRAGWRGLLWRRALHRPAMLIVLTLAWLYVASGATRRRRGCSMASSRS